MSRAYEHIEPDFSKWPITIHDRNKKKFAEELIQLIFDRISNGSFDKETMISKAIYMEMHRIKNKPLKVDPKDEKSFWKDISSKLKMAQSNIEKDEIVDKLLIRIINRYVEEITGNFKPKTFKRARYFLNVFFRGIFNRFSDGGLFSFWGDSDLLRKKIKLYGDVELVRKLFPKTTMVVVPTHFSNLDSLMVGYSLDFMVGLPAFTYGAGLNLFDYEIPGYLMNRLGTYKVDRRKKNPIYLECLKTYVSYALQNGVNNIFFPGGTRSRSGALESKLKLGLLGSIIEAQREHVFDNIDKKIIIVPVVIGYHFVFEAKSLIEQHLKSAGKDRYRRYKGAKGKSTSIWSMIKMIFSRKSEIHFSIGQPMDVFGNSVDENAISTTNSGDRVDFKGYFEGIEGYNVDGQREQVYTQILGESIVKSFLKHNVILCSHLIAFLAFKYFEQERSEEDVYSIVNHDVNELSIPLETFKKVLDSTVRLLMGWEKEGKLRLSSNISDNVDSVLKTGLEHLGVYHLEKTLYIEEDKKELKTENLKLLNFYHNRLLGYDLEKYITIYK